MPAPREVGQDRFDGRGIGLRDGRTFRLAVGPGMASLTVSDRQRAERAAQAVLGRRSHAATEQGMVMVQSAGMAALDALGRQAVEVAGGGTWEASRVIVHWSAKSRTRMHKAFASVDWTALRDPETPLAMVTLTYPGQWEGLVPSGKVAKRHLSAFRLRYGRAVGRKLRGAWKLEFQRRGAPHFHLLMPVPALVRGERFEVWLSRTWAAIVGAEGEERQRHERAGTGVDFAKVGRMSDPKRLAVYFAKHGSKSLDDKEYQHNVPALWQLPGMGPGRFWGFWGMPPATAVVDLDVWDFLTARRVLRRLAKANGRAVAYRKARAQGATVAAAVHVKGRRLRSLGSGGSMTGGWVMVNSGTALAFDLVRAVNLARSLL